MKVITRKFGEIEIEEKKILSMPHGLPGFPGLTCFILLEDAATAPFCWFQSVEDPNIAITIVNPLLFKPDYKPDLKVVIAGNNWKGIQEEELLKYVVINILEEKSGKKVTANLMGPLVINPENNEVVQVVLSDSSYSLQYNLLEPD